MWVPLFGGTVVSIVCNLLPGLSSTGKQRITMIAVVMGVIVSIAVCIYSMQQENRILKMENARLKVANKQLVLDVKTSEKKEKAYSDSWAMVVNLLQCIAVFSPRSEEFAALNNQVFQIDQNTKQQIDRIERE